MLYKLAPQTRGFGPSVATDAQGWAPDGMPLVSRLWSRLPPVNQKRIAEVATDVMVMMMKTRR